VADVTGPAAVADLFRDAMAGLCSGVAVLTARRPDGQPCGLVATSLSAFSAAPPSVLTSIGHVSRCHTALAECRHFGVHILMADQERLAHVFASLAEDKFDGVDWDWDDDVPELAGALAYLRCRRSALFELYDHSILIGDVLGGTRAAGEPLVYLERRMDWRLRPSNVARQAG
jgi:flavin reductase (DIM6/NTAB) family NADH-FMN oxidoreductase RutF